MPYVNKDLFDTYHRMKQAERRLKQAVEDKQPAKKIAHLNELYEAHKADYVAIKLTTMGL